MPNAILLFQNKAPLPGGRIIEIILWLLPEPLPGSSHNYKYRLHYGYLDGECIVRYDNERGKGDHRHFEGKESPYHFKNIETLQADFHADIRRHNERQRL